MTLPAAEAPAASQRSRALDGVVTLVARGLLEPGERTSEVLLEETLNQELRIEVNRTAVRQALAIMFRDGLVGQRPQSGVWVWPVSIEEATEALRLRRQVEPPAVSTLIETEIVGTSALGHSADRALYMLEHSSDVDELIVADGELHAELMRAAGSTITALSLISWMQRLRIFFWRGGLPYRTLVDEGKIRSLGNLDLQLLHEIREQNHRADLTLVEYFRFWGEIVSGK